MRQQTVSPVNHQQDLETSLSTLHPDHGSSELSRSPEPHSQGDFALPAPIDLGGVPAPKTPDKRSVAPLGTPTNRPPVGCRQRIGAGPDQVLWRLP